MIQINLLPREMRRARGLALPKSALIGAGAGAAVILLLAGITLFQVYRLSEMDTRITEVQRQADKMRDDIIMVDRLVDVKSKVLARLAAIDKLDRGRERWVNIINEFSNRVPEFLWMTAFKPVVSPGKNVKGGVRMPNAVAAADSTGSAEERLNIEGYSFTLHGLANFLVELNSSEYFDELELNYAKVVEMDQQRVYNFSLNCLLE